MDLLAKRLRLNGERVRSIREPGGTAIGEEIRHLLKHHPAGRGMDSETELFLINASRAQLVREVIRPALAAGEIVICDRFYDSTVAYQGHGRGLNLEVVQSVIGHAVGETHPDLTLLLQVPLDVSESRRAARMTGGMESGDRFDEAGRDFFTRVEQGFESIRQLYPKRIRAVDATDSVEIVHENIWEHVNPFLKDPIA